ncbi:putative signaling protein [bioreactor metagenome]|uniref:Putative signaling protein n=1 Tax=bioreactor metagenome TaxID=1076179 RepID=A0A645F8T1_9ZZZZ
MADNGYAHLHVAVNVSPYQLCSDGFIESVRAVLQEIDVAPRQIELEITESALIGSLEEGARHLQALKDLGLGLSLDDFGTGYSSLTYLQQLPVNTLKIDKAFIDMIILQDTKKGIIKTIVDMAHSLQLTVVAEGVETQEQLAYLAQCSCDRLQGYIISRPVPEEDAIQLLKS